MNQIKKNFIYNVFYQILSLIIPIVTVPYVSRVLGSSGVGIFSYTLSIVNYFMLVALLGINNYGVRTVAKVRDNKEKLSKTFLGIYSIQLFMSLIMILLYIIYIYFFDNSYRLIASIELIYLLSCVFDINWFFFGLEEFKLTVTRNTLLKIFTLLGIFIFVKSSNDLWLYTLIFSLSTLITQFILIPYLFRRIKFIKISFDDIKVHIKPIIVLFVPVVAVSLYKIMDKIMLGNLSVINEVGFYEQAEKIVSIPLGIITALGTVMMPRISNLVALKNDIAIKNYMYKSIKFMMFLAFPIAFGLISISHDFVPLFLGDDFVKSSILLCYLATTIIFISFANVIRTQYLIPKEKDKIYIVSVFGGALINLITNYLLIPRIDSIGACIGTILAEFFVMIYQVIMVRKEIPIKKYLYSIKGYFINAIIMFIILMLVNLIDILPIYRFTINILLGIVIYSLLNKEYIKELLIG